MLETLRNAWRVDDIRKKLIYTFVVIVLFRIGSAIPVPYVDKEALGEYFSLGAVYPPHCLVILTFSRVMRFQKRLCLHFRSLRISPLPS